jgi:catechol 2,3-dioxygenase-like lactoylglutathione lyase family enzyme
MHHVDIVVSSFDRSLPLYRELLEPLGYRYAAEIRGERGETVWYLDGEGVGVSLGIREAQSPAAHERYAVGLHHLAFEASSRELVDERYRGAVAQGLEIENEPRGWPYIPGYYAAFFDDPTASSSRSSTCPDQGRVVKRRFSLLRCDAQARLLAPAKRT